MIFAYNKVKKEKLTNEQLKQLREIVKEELHHE